MPSIVPMETIGGRRLTASWSSGKEVVDRGIIFRGWFLDVGSDPDLDAACQQAGMQQGQLSHLDGAVREHWLMPSPTVIFPLIDGLASTRLIGLARGDVARAGVGCSWPAGQRSRLGVMALVRDLLAVGYVNPIPFCVSSTSTDDLLAALVRHHEVLVALEEAARSAGRPQTWEFYHLGLPLLAGDKVARGSGTLTTAISPITCGHPRDLSSRETLRAIVSSQGGLRAPEIVSQRKAECWPDIVAWATEFGAARRVGGESDQASERVLTAV